MVYPLLPQCSNFQITEFSPALETDFESIFVSGGYNQGGRGLYHFASEPFIYLRYIMTPSRDPDHAVNLPSVHGTYTYLCVCAVHLCKYMRVCVYVCVSINNQAALYIGVMKSHLIP